MKSKLKQAKSQAKSFLLKLVPTSIIEWHRERKQRRQIEQKQQAFLQKIKANYEYDLERFSKYSVAAACGSLGNLDEAETQTHLRALITMEYHRIEKGLALKEPRVGFGAKTIDRLIKGLTRYQQLYGSDELVEIAINTLLTYYKFNLENGNEDKQLYAAIRKLQDNIEVKHLSFSARGGVMKVEKERILAATQNDLKSFFHSRYSVRDFVDTEVDLELIEQAVEMAQKTPSVCNRQSSKVYVFSSAADKARVLGHQNGNRGFGDRASKVLIVTSDMQNFASVGERNQCWIDGGMYAMSLVYALHSLGLGTCCLNWSVEFEVDRQLRDEVGISDSEAVIMMIAVGHLPDEFFVAQSPRKKVDEVLVVRS